MSIRIEDVASNVSCTDDVIDNVVVSGIDSAEGTGITSEQENGSVPEDAQSVSVPDLWQQQSSEAHVVIEEDVVSSVSTEDSDAHEEDIQEVEEISIRRSGRERRPRDRFKSEDFRLCQQNVSISDWQQRCIFLSELMSKFPNHESQILHVILKITSTM